ncbi:lipopolysaccharide-induced tumor necrosis factor-alpha factor homolog isoform X2 [Astyanax mexicanus]|uniref:lipopolysaccharide-induced tumor necrosis factor-alpha factor homolog isoform X1 n=1 Tax=Astyanax mexicanus TaxID=7994 RepID=UPI0003CD4842|nr:lipopolysaccharide-induced tumor necrosis factor-alpha factor homolog isoform X1 [Astyanax mexicanus]XP_049325336.1 lipopolysaccharide-induced tumor necrosis factor-alpha factor homolog isoform X2 [Astyanax mexicanus]XP_049325337.1 lipopolysaccharide-induced tumor necrosis factor-alpha factor homolog isoform X2 [Astyanax mexicanus]
MAAAGGQVVVLGPFTDSPVQVTCPTCRHTAVTQVQYNPGLLTYLFCGGLLFCGCFLGCCLIPFCVDRLRDAKHVCSNCKAVLGVYKRL